MKKWFGYFGFFGILFLTSLSGCTKAGVRLETTATPGQRKTPVTAPATQTPAVSSKCASNAAGPLLRQEERALFVEPSESGSRIIAYDDFTGTSKEITTVTGTISWIVVSKDGKQLAYLSAKDDTLVVIDLPTGNEVRHLIGGGGNIRWVREWTEDGRVTVDTHREELEGRVLYQNLLINPQTGQTEVQEGLYSLPGYYQPPDDYYYDRLSIDPREKRALYHTLVEGEGQPSKSVLIDLENQQVLWENPGSYSGYPGWSKDGSRVVFGSLYGKDPLPKMLSLSRDGKISVLSNQLPDPYQWAEYRYFKVSPSDRYIHFALLWGDPHAGPGFVLDTETGAFWEICGYSGNLFRSSWLDQSDDLIYQIMEDDENHFFIFDANSKQTRKLISGKRLEYIGISSVTALGK